MAPFPIADLQDGVLPVKVDPSSMNITGVIFSDVSLSCTRENQGKYTWSKIAVISEDENVRNNAQEFF